MICPLFLYKKAYHDFIFMIYKTEYVLFKKKHDDYVFCQINEKYNMKIQYKKDCERFNWLNR